MDTAVDYARLLNAHDVAKKTGLSIYQVYRRIKRGDLAATFTSNGYLIDPEDLDTWIAAGQPLSRPNTYPMDMLTVPQIQKLTGYTEETVRKLCQDGYLQYRRESTGGGRYLILRESFERFMAERAANRTR